MLTGSFSCRRTERRRDEARPRNGFGRGREWRNGWLAEQLSTVPAGTQAYLLSTAVLVHLVTSHEKQINKCAQRTISCSNPNLNPAEQATVDAVHMQQRQAANQPQ
jgi:hypothetical protein